ncbi:MAG: SUMF1/EgtB/PvdO family nonheme iron enzyme [Bacteroidales bacterium]|nr:SUMF1/EgtB/PvdO family nonheme iron enzyme [Bacteroidales bacterium]MDD4217494.1 SUMF1/EgtB/PvdO family nonheme iron enzyme [Bacteroidales bacterium]MDY0140915.1 SUMF1/EgtB/PvdO family nonheme iron enzyme [Bacteroidales bacterium]
MKKNTLFVLIILVGVVLISSCKKETSSTTGWNYNDPNFGGFQNHPGYEQETGPGLVFVEGGSFAMGRVEQDVMYDWNNIPRRVTVSSFYMDETEVRNIDYNEYLYWLSYVYSSDYRFLYREALPDTLVWRERLAFNEPMVELYLRHPAYEQYPVVGVSWVKATKYCEWRTDRVNELILLREGVIDKYVAPQDQAKQFNTDAYLVYAENLDLSIDETGKGPDGKVQNLYVDPATLKAGRKGGNVNTGEDRRWVKMEDGIFLPRYRLPTEAEWEFAALAHIGNHYRERIYERRLYPWNGHYIRNDVRGEERGMMMANSMRGRGDNMGVSGALNDKADISAPVKSYWPNEYGLYCMAGNVNEWVMDVYRDLTFEDMDEFRPFRGNVYTDYEVITDPRSGDIELTPEAENYFDYSGKILRKPVRDEECYSRENYTTSDNRNYLDGDLESLIPNGNAEEYWVKGDRFQVESDAIKVNDPIDGALTPENVGDIYPGATLMSGGNEILLPNGVKVDLQNMTYILPTGHEKTSDGNIMMPDGSMILEGGKLQLADGSIIYPDQFFTRKTPEMYKEGNWGEYGEWGFGQFNPANPKINKGDGATGNQMTSLVSDRSRVFKGGSWKDRAYWMVPGTRRFLDEKLARADLGFRCAMDRVGSPTLPKK